MPLIQTEIEPGRPYRLSPLVQRITAPNGGRMTGPGTNTYIVGDKELAIIDPGPLIDTHVEAILKAVDGKQVRWIVATHTHPDHSPAAKPLAEATGAMMVGCLMDSPDGHQDNTFKVERNVQEGDILSNGEYTLEAIFTPGHIGNHFCFLLREEELLFAGDHIMQGVSVVIIPPSGDLKDFLDSLEKLKKYSIKAFAPAHGEIIEEPEQEVQKLVKHRLYRENKVISAMKKVGQASLDDLVKYAYDDVDQALYKVARYSLWAHLLKLEREGRAVKTIHNHWAFGEEQWKLIN